MSDALVVSNYKDTHQSLDNLEQQLTSTSNRLSILRLIIFISTIALTILLASYQPIIAVIVCILGLGLFLYIVKTHHRKDRERQIVSYKKSIISNELDAISKLENENYDGLDFIDQDHNYTSDLDVFGPFSLYALVNRCRTFNGINILAGFMSMKPSLTDIQDRITAIEELENDTEWRINFYATLYEIQDGQNINTAKIVEGILDTDLSFATEQKLSLYRKIVPILWLGLGTLYFIYPDVSYILAIVLGLINFRITMKHAEKVSAIQNRLSKAGNQLDKYAEALTIISERQWSAPIIKSKIAGNSQNENQVKALRKLKSISDLLDYRLHMIPAFLLNIGLLWDSKITASLSNWHVNHGHQIKETFDLIGLVEAFSSLATWSYNHPAFSYARVTNEYFYLNGVDLRHPLLHYEECVPNDYNLRKGDYMSVITGSNMSGKSTILRTIGLNMILGYCGTKVAAMSLSYGLVELITYMRIKDNLEESVSTFKSELNRVVKILDLLKSDKQSFIIADEMLRGTNSHDKLKGSKAIVLEVIKHQAYGMVATHDIALAEMGEDHDGISNFYFDIDYADGDLLFDYKIKPGICENFNASFLLSQLGLNVTQESPKRKHIK